MGDLTDGLFFLAIIVGPLSLAAVSVIVSGRNDALETRRQSDLELASIELEKIRLKTISELHSYGVTIEEAMKATEPRKEIKEETK